MNKIDKPIYQLADSQRRREKASNQKLKRRHLNTKLRRLIRLYQQLYTNKLEDLQEMNS